MDLPADLDPVEASLLERLASLLPRPVTPSSPLPTGPSALTAATLLEAEVTSRLVDHTARWMRATTGDGYYTIGSAGHEANAAVALALRPTDPALLHYRSGGFYMARSMQAHAAGITTSDPVVDVVRGMLAKTTEPIAGGRHKVFGNHALSIIPQTSTIASHLPRAVGLARSFSIAEEAPTAWPTDSVVVCSFGDASLNHSTAQGALNWASHEAHAGRRVPVIFVCEDNGLGLSVPSPDGWVGASSSQRPAMDVIEVDGFDPVSVLNEVGALAARVRETGRPGFVQLRTVRFLGHAGTDVESAYRTPEAIQSDRDRDPIIGAAQLAVDLGSCSAAECVDWYLDLRSSIRDTALALRVEPEFASADEVMAPLRALRPAAPSPGAVGTGAAHPTGAPLTLAQTINRALADQLEASNDVVLFGEDVARKGGVYGVTRGLQKRFGEGRVFDSLLDEQSILGMALGASLNGRLPLPEIQYLAYFHNAEDQLRGEAATLSFFSQGQYRNPMVVRIAAYGYQKGFGGHFHNDNSVAVLRDIPGIVIASPSHPSDAAGMLHACVDHARQTGAVCVYLEPIARYHDADTTATYDPTPVPIGSTRSWTSDGEDLVILTWGNGAHLSREAQAVLADEHGVNVTVVDLRWLAPLPVADMVEAARRAGRVLVVDETRRTGGVGEGIVAELIDGGFRGTIRRVTGKDSFIPLGAAANLVLVSTNDIVQAAVDLARQ